MQLKAQEITPTEASILINQYITKYFTDDDDFIRHNEIQVLALLGTKYQKHFVQCYINSLKNSITRKMMCKKSKKSES